MSGFPFLQRFVLAASRTLADVVLPARGGQPVLPFR